MFADENVQIVGEWLGGTGGQGHVWRSHFHQTNVFNNNNNPSQRKLHAVDLNNIFIEFVSVLNIFTYIFFFFFFKFRKNTNTEHLVSKMNVGPKDLMVAGFHPGFRPIRNRQRWRRLHMRNRKQNRVRWLKSGGGGNEGWRKTINMPKGGGAKKCRVVVALATFGSCDKTWMGWNKLQLHRYLK